MIDIHVNRHDGIILHTYGKGTGWRRLKRTARNGQNGQKS